MNTNIGSQTRGRQARAVADMLLSMRSDSRTINDLSELTGLQRECITGWVNALEDVGLIVEGARRKITGQGGNVARTWRMP